MLIKIFLLSCALQIALFDLISIVIGAECASFMLRYKYSSLFRRFFPVCQARVFSTRGQLKEVPSDGGETQCTVFLSNLPFSNYHELSSPSSPFHHGHDFRLEDDFVIRASSSNLPLCSCTIKEVDARRRRDPHYRQEGGISEMVGVMSGGIKKNIYGYEV